MLSAVEFDDELLLPACEISENGTDRMLADETMPAKMAVAQLCPQQALWFRAGAAQLAGLDGRVRLLALGPHPALRATLSRKRKRGRGAGLGERFGHRLLHAREGEFGAGFDAGGPAGGDGFDAGIKVHALRAVDGVVAEDGAFPAAEGVVG